MKQKKNFFLKKNPKFFKIANSQNFFVKISQIRPWVSRIAWCEGHWSGSTYMVVRLSDISSKTGKKSFFMFLGHFSPALLFRTPVLLGTLDYKCFRFFFRLFEFCWLMIKVKIKVPIVYKVGFRWYARNFLFFICSITYPNMMSIHTYICQRVQHNNEWFQGP